MTGTQEIARHELDNLTEQQQSLDTEIERLAEQSTELHTLYARQVNMFILQYYKTLIDRMSCLREYLVVTTGHLRRTSWRKRLTARRSSATGSWRQTSSGSRPNLWWTTVSNSLPRLLAAGIPYPGGEQKNYSFENGC